MTKYVDICAILKKHGAQEIRYYSLINNSGYVFTLDGSRYDLRHWRNIYGVEVDHYNYVTTKDASEETSKKLRAILEEIKEAIRGAE